ncbi:MAG: hypothetical protein AAF789_10650 [Bacteroidota bacterium]
MFGKSRRIIVRSVSILALTLGLVTITSCGDDDEADAGFDQNVLVGEYVLSSAVTSSSVEINDQLTIQSGENVTAQISGALLNASPCLDLADPTTIIDIQADETFDLTCSSDPSLSVDGGSWSADEEGTALILRLIQSDGAGGTINVTVVLANLEISDNGISGTISQLTVPRRFFDGVSDFTDLVRVDLMMTFSAVE